MMLRFGGAKRVVKLGHYFSYAELIAVVGMISGEGTLWADAYSAKMHHA